MEQEIIEIIKDEDFVPHVFLDTFFSSILATKSTESSSAPAAAPAPASASNTGKSNEDLELINKNSTILLSNLELLTKRLNSNLNSNLSNLNSTNSIISYSFNSSNGSTSNNNNLNLKSISKLEYFIDSISSSIKTLNLEIKEVNSKTDKTGSHCVDTLKQLNLIKENFKKVLSIFELLKSIIDINYSTIENLAPTSISNTAPNSVSDVNIISIKPKDFQDCLDELFKTVKLQISSVNPNEFNTKLINKINTLIEIQPIFKNLTNFNNIYTDFVKKLTIEKKNYLQLQKHHENDEDFYKSVLS